MVQYNDPQFLEGRQPQNPLSSDVVSYAAHLPLFPPEPSLLRMKYIFWGFMDGVKRKNNSFEKLHGKG